MQRLFEGLLVRDLTRHQKAERLFDARIVSDVDKPFVDDSTGRRRAFLPGIIDAICGGILSGYLQ
jgi:hypothetical protein